VTGAQQLAHRLDGGTDGATADTVLLLNGGFMTFAAWEPFVGPLAERCRVLRCDFRGQMATPGPAHPDLAANADDALALLDHLGLDAVHLVGASFGGEVALVLAARHPERVRSLVVVTASDRTTPAMTRGAREIREVIADIQAGGDPGRFHDHLVKEIYSRSWAAANAEQLAARRRQIAAIPASWFAGLDGLVAAVEDFDLRPELGRIRCPTLIFVAGDDQVMPPDRGRALADGIAGARLVEHPTSGHALLVEETPWLIERTVAFLEEQTVPGGEG